VWFLAGSRPAFFSSGQTFASFTAGRFVAVSIRTVSRARFLFQQTVFLKNVGRRHADLRVAPNQHANQAVLSS
jgi:hypothetical protein